MVALTAVRIMVMDVFFSNGPKLQYILLLKEKQLEALWLYYYYDEDISLWLQTGYSNLI